MSVKKEMIQAYCQSLSIVDGLLLEFRQGCKFGKIKQTAQVYRATSQDVGANELAQMFKVIEHALTLEEIDDNLFPLIQKVYQVRREFDEAA